MRRISGLEPAPKLVFVRVGEDPASASYVRSKSRLAKRAGVLSETHVLPESTTAPTLLDLIDGLNRDDLVDGILVQLPLPPHLDPAPVLERIRPDKDVDGFHPVNVGRLWSGADGLFPATPLGLIDICDHYGIEIAGAEVVIVGRSNLVGKPAAAMFLRRNGTVTLAHSRTRDLPSLTRRADILVAAAGRPGLIEPGMVKEGANVLDVGLTRVDGELLGDVAEGVSEVAAGVTPMPGGTGPVTVAMVVRNTATAALQRRARA
jgi:methylenetetrahydrofolate dehydrogenase (NADP+)/methenyltetrahydrofolate cyclohydrolase